MVDARGVAVVAVTHVLDQLRGKRRIRPMQIRHPPPRTVGVILFICIHYPPLSLSQESHQNAVLEQSQKEASATCVSFGFTSHVVKRTPSFGLAVSVHMLLLSITTLNTAEP